MLCQKILGYFIVVVCLVFLFGCETEKLAVKQEDNNTVSMRENGATSPSTQSQTNRKTENSDTVDNYQLFSGDLLSIKVFGHDDLTLNDVRVDDVGQISYPFLGELVVAGMTTGELEKQLASRLSGDYVIDPKVTVRVLEYRQFFINGEVEKPGGYAFLPGLTVQKAVTLAGGFTELAARNDITVIREKDQSMQPQSAKLTTQVNPGDIITINESFF